MKRAGRGALRFDNEAPAGASALALTVAASASRAFMKSATSVVLLG